MKAYTNAARPARAAPRHHLRHGPPAVALEGLSKLVSIHP